MQQIIDKTKFLQDFETIKNKASQEDALSYFLASRAPLKKAYSE
jgi:hypothetical protein